MTPTFLQKLLGRNYKWWYIIIYALKSNTTYRWNSFMWVAGSSVMIFATILVWYIAYSAQPDFQSNFSLIFTYLIVGESIILGNAIQFHIGEDIQDGKITAKLLIPTNYLAYYVIYNFGYQLFENFSKFLLYGFVGLFFYQNLIWPSPINLILFIIAAALAYIIITLIGMMVGASSFWLTAFFGSVSFFDSLKLVLSGKFFPLNSLSILTFTTFLPFSFTFFHPMQIYLGKYNPTETLYVFLGGIGWCLVIYFLTKLVFLLGLKKNEAVGL